MAVRVFFSANLRLHSAQNSLARGAKASSITLASSEKSFKSHVTLIEKCFFSSSTCSSRLRIFPPRSKTKLEIRETRPRLSGQVNNKIAELVFFNINDHNELKVNITNLRRKNKSFVS